MSEIGCQHCGTYDIHPPCERCGFPVHIGSTVQCPHEKAVSTKGFEPHFDIGLGKYLTGEGDRNAALRPQWNKDYVTHLQPRDLPAVHYRELKQRRAERAARAKEQRGHS